MIFVIPTFKPDSQSLMIFKFEIEKGWRVRRILLSRSAQTTPVGPHRQNNCASYRSNLVPLDLIVSLDGGQCMATMTITKLFGNGKLEKWNYLKYSIQVPLASSWQTFPKLPTLINNLRVTIKMNSF